MTRKIKIDTSKRKTIVFKINEETALPWAFIDSVPSQGRADDAVMELLEYWTVEVTLQDSIKYLNTFGAWELDELQDLDRNTERIVWIACLHCQENKTQFFYMGE